MPWYTWSCIPLDVKRQMWERFKEFYTWDPALDAKMQEIWERRCLKNYNDNLSAARSRAAGLSNRAGHPYDRNDPRRDMNLLKPYHPDWLSPAIWIAMIDHWNNEHWKAVSVGSRKNRMTEVDGEISKHTNGSRSFGAQGALMTKANNGVPPSCLELFDKTHKKRSASGSTSSDTGEYVTSRCSRVADEYATSLSQKYGDDPSNHPLVDKELWEQAVGGMKKGRLFGFGYNNDIDGVLTGTSAQGGTSSSSQEIEVLKTQVQELLERDRLREAEEEKRKKQYEDMAALVVNLSQSRQFSTQTPQPPPDIL
ncbi:hypothetical protein OSB04_013424 [Centaurea solstitialis]|uniref:Transposase n=1 Tax=Centaurea solstitialis TaxID=347529 RepID=A0AA38TD79_9ASTR|nr:hypothetical protein OSB04_013424 [Centaurea solstitialis]